MPYKIEDGGHLGNYNYHSALITTIKENEKLITNTSYDDESKKSFESNKTNKIENRDIDFMNKIPQLRGISSQWRNKEQYKIIVQNNYFEMKCCSCGFAAALYDTKRRMKEHFNNRHLRNYSRDKIDDIKSLLELLGFTLR